MIKYKIRGSDWLTFLLIIDNSNHFFIQLAAEMSHLQAAPKKQRRLCLHNAAWRSVFVRTRFESVRVRVARVKGTFSNKSALVWCKRNPVLSIFCAVFNPTKSSVNVVLY